jgi:hypothetical protein
MTTLSLVRTYWPAYDGVSDAVVDTIIADVAAEIGAVAAHEWGVLYGRGVAALTAHLLELRARSVAATGSANGPGTGSTALSSANSVKTGDLSVSYADGASLVAGKDSAGLSDAIYASTIGGQEYLRLRGRLARILVVTA